MRIFDYISKSITWSLFNLKTSNLIKLRVSMSSFWWWRQVINIRFETHPSSLHNSKMADRQHSYSGMSQKKKLKKFE